jgi:NhaP-type Na+/H+ or K+/H+ antiporter
VFAVVVCGLYLGRRSNSLFSPNVRLQAYGFWNSLIFALNGLVFVLIGLQLPFVLTGIRGYKLSSLLVFGALFSALLIALRLVWTYPGAYVAYFVRRHLLHQNERTPSPRGIFVVGWTGMRGVIALAAAISLPETLANGDPFPQRNLIIFLTFCVILVTLVLQGLTLPWLIRVLRVASPGGPSSEDREARRTVLETALRHLEERRHADDSGELTEALDDLIMHYQRRLAATQGTATPGAGVPEDHARTITLSRQVLSIERQTAVRLRNEGLINDEVLRQLERELDLSETHLEAKTQH